MQDDYIPTLPLPPSTTIAGMISYLSDKRFEVPFDIAVIGSYEYKDRKFIRGEKKDHWPEYEKFVKNVLKEKYGKINIGGTKSELVNRIKNINISTLSIEELKQKKNKNLKQMIRDFKNEKKREIAKNGKYYLHYKTKEAENRIMNFEVLHNVELTIYLKVTTKKDFSHIFNALKEIPYYPCLGRKEDFAMIKNLERIEVEQKKIDIEKAIENNYLLQNTYIPVSLNNEKDDYLMTEGTLYSLPKIYESLKDPKKDRSIVHDHYLYIDESGIFPKNRKICIDNKNNNIFNWLIGI